ncbi:MAG: ChaN family lipoprotein, partial [Betaproteobacteria bacterium]
AIVERGAQPAMVFEQFDLGRDDALGRAQREPTSADRLAEAGALDRRAWQWPLHRPIIEVALSAHLPIYAGNATRTTLESVTRKNDLSGLPMAWQARLDGARWTARQAAVLREDIVEGHCGKLPDAMIPRLVLAQRVRDAAMAEALLQDANADGAILIAGNGHARRDLGVPVYLGEAAGNTLSVGLIEVEPAPLQAADAARTAAMKVSGFDYVWLTPEAPRDDPCAALAISSAPTGRTISPGGATSTVPPAERN